MSADLYVTTFMYSACKVVGTLQWPAYQRAQLASLDALDAAEWPAFRAIGQAARLEALTVMVDAGTYITRARSRAAGLFLDSGCDVWLSFDDDNYADAAVLRQLVKVVRATGGMCSAPYANRDRKTMTFERVRGPTAFVDGAPVRDVNRIGLGMTAIHRNAVRTLARGATPWRDIRTPTARDPNVLCELPALFLESIVDGMWTGEDYSFCDRVAAAELPNHALLDAPCFHAGTWAKLDLDGRILVLDPDVAADMHEATDATAPPTVSDGVTAA
jgi:hypothetical protein